MTQKAKKRSKLRHAEYYDMQNIFDELYAKSRDGEIFNNLKLRTRISAYAP